MKIISHDQMDLMVEGELYLVKSPSVYNRYILVVVRGQFYKVINYESEYFHVHTRNIFKNVELITTYRARNIMKDFNLEIERDIRKAHNQEFLRRIMEQPIDHFDYEYDSYDEYILPDDEEFSNV